MASASIDGSVPRSFDLGVRPPPLSTIPPPLSSGVTVPSSFSPVVVPASVDLNIGVADANGTTAKRKRKWWVTLLIAVGVILLLSILLRALFGPGCQKQAEDPEADISVGCRIVGAVGAVAGAVEWAFNNLWAVFLAGIAGIAALAGGKAFAKQLDPKRHGSLEEKTRIAEQERRLAADKEKKKAELAEAKAKRKKRRERR